MKPVLRFLWMVWLLAGCVWTGYGAGEMQLLDMAEGRSAAVAHPALEVMRSVDDEGKVIEPEVVLKDAKTDWRDTLHWLKIEREHLLIMAIGIGCSVLIGLGIAWLLHWVLRLHFEGNAGFKRKLAQALAGPLVLLVTLVSIFLFMVPVVNSIPHAYPHDVRIFLALVAMIVAWAAFHLVELFACKMRKVAERESNNLNELMVELVRKVLKIIILLLLVFFVGQSIFNIDLSALMAGAGVAGLAVAFAAKDVLANFFGTIVIVVDQPFYVGDRIQINDCDGLVTQVGMRSTRILTADESVYTIPNSIFTAQEVQNVSREGMAKYVFTTTMTYSTTPEQMEQVIQILHGIVDNFHGEDAPQFKPRIFFSALADSSMNVEVIMWLKTSDFKVEEEWKGEINFAIIRQFNAANLNMAFPTTTNYLLGAPASPIVVQMAAPPVPPPESERHT